MKAFVLGNGESRQKLNVSPLSKYGFIYGCNGIYRDLRPDFLITVDPTMAKEIAKTDYIDRWQVYTPYSDLQKLHKNFVLFKSSARLCAGVTASLIAIQHGAKEIYLIGHDLGSSNGLINNIYKNSNNYKQAWEDDESFNVYTPHYLQLLKSHPHIDFIRVMGKQTFSVKDFKSFKNYKETKIDTFQKNFS